MTTSAPPRPRHAPTAHRRRPHHRGDMNRDTGARRPPHDLAAERALLGAALLDRHAAGVVAALDAGDFYAPVHGHIAAAIAALHRRDEPSDPVTVAAELRTAGLLDVEGGVPTADLVVLQAGTPSTTRAPSYAAIVREHAAARRVLAIAGELLERGYAGIPAAELLDEARRRLDAAAPAAGESTLAWADVAAILANGTAPTIDPDFLVRSDHRPLLYAGRIHVFQAEPTAGKTWIALLAVLELLDLGATVVYLDLEDTDAGILGRLLALGATAEQLVNQFALVRPHGPLGELELADLEQRALAANPDLVIIDGVAEALANDGLDENDNIEVVTWVNRVPKRIAAATGAAVVLLDHVSKSKEDRGRWARGAGAKLGAVDGAAYELRVIEPFSRDHAGHIRLLVAKDRPGAVGPTGSTAANAYIEPTAHGAVVRIRLEPPSDDEADGKPTFVMTEISRWLATNGPAPEMDVAQVHRRFKGHAVKQAIVSLLAGSYIRTGKDDGRRALFHVKPYPPDSSGPPEPQSRLELDDTKVTSLEEWKRQNF